MTLVGPLALQPFVSRRTNLSERLVLPVPRLVNQYFVAFACCVFQVAAVHNRHFSPRIGDEAGFLKNSRGYSYARPACAQHVRQKLLRQRYLIAANPVLSS